MNERIKELIDQMNQNGFPYQEDDCSMTVTHRDLEYLAELIVRECAKVCNDVGTAVWAEPHQNNIGTAQTCKAAIEKHFGVENE